MNRNSNVRTILATLSFLVFAIAICISNFIKLNIFALSMGGILIMALCFVLGYHYYKYEFYKGIKEHNCISKNIKNEVNENNENFEQKADNYFGEIWREAQ